MLCASLPPLVFVEHHAFFEAYVLTYNLCDKNKVYNNYGGASPVTFSLS